MSGDLADAVSIADRVRDAHLSHFCPGGLGLAVTSSQPVGLDEAAAGDGRIGTDPDGNRLRADGAACSRCHGIITAVQGVRRRLTGELVHETCPEQMRGRSAHPPGEQPGQRRAGQAGERA